MLSIIILIGYCALINIGVAATMSYKEFLEDRNRKPKIIRVMMTVVYLPYCLYHMAIGD